MSKLVKLFAAFPTYDGSRYNTRAIVNLLQTVPGTLWTEPSGSLLAHGFNQAWCLALNMREAGEITHFLLLHSDIVPVDTDWFKQLYNIMRANQLDVLSTIVPLKSSKGLTSTAIEGETVWSPRRLTMTEVMKMEETWTRPDLLFNSGLLLVNMASPKVTSLYFTINDRISKQDGKWVTDVESEDWNFARQCKHLGLKFGVTRKVKVHHVGTMAYGNYERWGTWETDQHGKTT